MSVWILYGCQTQGSLHCTRWDNALHTRLVFCTITGMAGRSMTLLSSFKGFRAFPLSSTKKISASARDLIDAILIKAICGTGQGHKNRLSFKHKWSLTISKWSTRRNKLRKMSSGSAAWLSWSLPWLVENLSRGSEQSQVRRQPGNKARGFDGPRKKEAYWGKNLWCDISPSCLVSGVLAKGNRIY